MKKYQIIAVLLLTSAFTCSSSWAQGEARIGMKIGMVQANVAGSDVHQISNNGTAKSLMGMMGGVFVNSKFHRNFWIKSELAMVQSGSELKVVDQWGQQYQSKLRSLYLQASPISPTFHFQGFQVFAGPYVGMLLNTSREVKDQAGNLYLDTSIFGSPSANSGYRQKLDAGVVVGVEYLISYGVCVGLSYTRGFVPLYEKANAVAAPNAPETPQQKIYNQSWQAYIGFVFGEANDHNKKSKK